MGASTLQAHAYVDPGTGSYVFQLLIAGLTGLFFLFSSLSTKVLALFRSKGPAGSGAAEPADELSPALENCPKVGREPSAPSSSQ